MPIYIKIGSVILTVVLGLAPTFFNLIEPIDPTTNLNIYQRTTGLGIVFLVGSFIALCASIWILVDDENDSKELKNTIEVINAKNDTLQAGVKSIQEENSSLKDNLTDVKTAIEKAGLKYDDATNSIITVRGSNNNVSEIKGNQNTVSQTTGSHVGTVQGAGSTAIGHIYENINIGPVPPGEAGVDVKIMMPENSTLFDATVKDVRGRIFDTNPFSSTVLALRSFAQDVGLSYKKVNLVALGGTNAVRYLPRAKQLLKKLDVDATIMPYPVPREELRRQNPYSKIDELNTIHFFQDGKTIILVIGNMDDKHMQSIGSKD